MDDLNLAIASFNAGRFDEALGRFRAVIAGGDRGPQTRCLLAHVLDSAGRTEEAFVEFAGLIETFPGHLPAYDGLAGLILRRGGTPDGAKALRPVLRARPSGRAPRRELAACLKRCAAAWRALGALDAAETALSKVVRLTPADKEARRLLVELLQSRVRSVPDSERRVLKLAPRSPQARRRLLDRLHRRAVESGRPLSSGAILRQARAAGAGAREARRHLLSILRERGRSPSPDRIDAAERELRKALALSPRDPQTRRLLLDVLVRRAQARLSAGDLDAAQVLLRRALAFAPADREVRLRLIELWRERARVWQSEGQRKKARGLYERILKLEPGHALTRLSLGELLCTSGDSKEGRSQLRRALRRGRGALPAAERFKALMKLGRHVEAIAVAEEILDGTPTLEDLRAFWDPWIWDERLPRAQRRAEYDALERSLGADSGSPWLSYYRADLAGSGKGELPDFDRLDARARTRYGWMFFKAATVALLAREYETARRWFKIALAQEPVDWRARAFLAETCLCLNRPGEAYAEMDRALAAAPAAEAGQVRAWRGAFDLWLGRYDEALVHLDRADREGAQCALCWKGAALLKLGRDAEALATLDEALRRYPLDFEAYVWRGEAKRRLGRPREALKDLEAIQFPDSSRGSPITFWALVNRALVRRALGDEAGMLDDFRALAPNVVDYIRRKKNLPLGSPPKPAEMSAILEAGLELSHGFRREEYDQAIWMI